MGVPGAVRAAFFCARTAEDTAMSQHTVARNARATLTPTPTTAGTDAGTDAGTTTVSPFAGKLLLTPTEAGQALGVDRTTIYTMMNAGELASLRIGRLRRLSVAELVRWIAARERQEAPRHV